MIYSRSDFLLHFESLKNQGDSDFFDSVADLKRSPPPLPPPTVGHSECAILSSARTITPDIRMPHAYIRACQRDLVHLYLVVCVISRKNVCCACSNANKVQKRQRKVTYPIDGWCDINSCSNRMPFSQKWLHNVFKPF